MSEYNFNYLIQFGNIKFAEQQNLCITDFENSLSKFFRDRKKIHGSYKFAEIENKSFTDFGKSLIEYFD